MEEKSISRKSPRKQLVFGRTERQLNKESDEFRALKDQVAALLKESEQRKVSENASLTASLLSIPSMSSIPIGSAKSSKKDGKISDDRAREKSSSVVDRSGKHKKSKASIPLDSNSSCSDHEDSSDSSSASTATSDSSDSDDYTRRKHRKKSSKHRSRTSTRRHAKHFINNVGKDGVMVYVNRIFSRVAADRDLKDTDKRSIHEAEVLANALDAFVTDKIDITCDGIEILVTRLIGLLHAVQTGDWTLMAAIRFKVIGTSTMPLSAQTMAKLMKQGQQIKALTSVTPVVKSRTTDRYSRSSTSGPYDAAGSAAQPHYKKNTGNSQSIKGTSAGTVSEKSGSKAP